jgi:ATP-dependent DNA helicase RecG
MALITEDHLEQQALDQVILLQAADDHPFDLSKILQHLTQAGMLKSTGGRGAVYHIPGQEIPTPDDVFGSTARFTASSSPNLASSSPNLPASSPNLAEIRDPDGCLITDQLALSVVDDLASLSPVFRTLMLHTA